jgi:purine-nucleoside phosphorylase
MEEKSMSAPTPHNAALKGQIAKKVLMPGDPLRAKFIVENFLDDYEQVNSVRNMYAFTGHYKGKEVTIMGSGMGMPSIGLYSYELYHFYDVDTIIRIGSAGALQDYMDLKDVVVAMGACTDSNYGAQYCLPGTFAPIASYRLVERAVEEAKKIGCRYHVGNIFSSDIFYNENAHNDKWTNMGVLAVEMEAPALYMNAARAGRKALTICTISDHVITGEQTTPEQRQTSFTKMMDVAFSLV